jgi:hypothetical protein
MCKKRNKWKDHEAPNIHKVLNTYQAPEALNIHDTQIIHETYVSFNIHEIHSCPPHKIHKNSIAVIRLTGRSWCSLVNKRGNQTREKSSFELMMLVDA